MDTHKTILQQICEHIDMLRITTKDTLTKQEAAQYIGLATGTVDNYCTHNRLPHYRQGTQVYFRRDELDKWMTTNKVLTIDERERKADEIIRELNNRNKAKLERRAQSSHMLVVK